MELPLLFLLSFCIGILGVLFGGTLFLSIPALQWIYPGLNYGQVIGNLKVGSFFRGLASTWSTWKQIDRKESLTLLIPFTASSILSTTLIAKIDQSYLLYAVISAILLTEFSPKLAHLISRKTRIIFSLILGFYAGLIGAGIGLLLVALLRTSFPRHDQIIFVNIQSRYIETVSTAFVVIAHLLYGNILFPLWLVWSAGMFLGGFIGGHILKKTVHFSPRVQHLYLWIVYALALLPFLLEIL